MQTDFPDTAMGGGEKGCWIKGMFLFSQREPNDWKSSLGLLAWSLLHVPNTVPVQFRLLGKVFSEMSPLDASPCVSLLKDKCICFCAVCMCLSTCLFQYACVRVCLNVNDWSVG